MTVGDDPSCSIRVMTNGAVVALGIHENTKNHIISPYSIDDRSPFNGAVAFAAAARANAYSGAVCAPATLSAVLPTVLARLANAVGMTTRSGGGRVSASAPVVSRGVHVDDEDVAQVAANGIDGQHDSLEPADGVDSAEAAAAASMVGLLQGNVTHSLREMRDDSLALRA